MAIKETPVTYHTYYKSLREHVGKERQSYVDRLTSVTKERDELYKQVKDNIEVYRDFGVNPLDFKEFRENKYTNGAFYRTAKGAFVNRKGEYKLISDLYDLFKLAQAQKIIHQLEKEIDKQDKILSLSLKEYNEVVRSFYHEVTREMILNGCGYAFEGKIGWLCINRCHLVNPKPKIDYKATMQKKADFIAKGIRPYNKEEAEWCKANGLEYDGIDYRVYLRKEYVYEIALIGCTMPEGSKYTFEVTDYRPKGIRGKTNEDLLKECNNDITKICELNVDMKLKLNLCNRADRTLYLKYIRNENQTPIKDGSANRKNRQ